MSLRELKKNIEELLVQLDARTNAVDLLGEFLCLTEEEQKRELFSRLLKGENIDVEHLQELLQEYTYEGESNKRQDSHLQH